MRVAPNSTKGKPKNISIKSLNVISTFAGTILSPKGCLWTDLITNQTNQWRTWLPRESLESLYPKWIDDVKAEAGMAQYGKKIEHSGKKWVGLSTGVDLLNKDEISTKNI